MSLNWKKCQGRSWDENEKWVSMNTRPPTLVTLAISSATTQGMAKCSNTAVE